MIDKRKGGEMKGGRGREGEEEKEREGGERKGGRKRREGGERKGGREGGEMRAQLTCALLYSTLAVTPAHSHFHTITPSHIPVMHVIV